MSDDMMAGIDGRISLRRLAVFVLIVEAGGVTRAAEELLVAQPAVSAQLRSLEESMGAALFVRSNNALVLTEAGGRVYRWAKEVLAAGAQVQRDVHELAAGAAGSVVITSSMAIGTYLLPPVLTRLRAARPGADIVCRVDQPAGALHSVQLGEADFAVLTWTGDELPDDVIGEHLWDEPLVLCASPHGPPDSDTIDVTDLADLTGVSAPPEVALHRLVMAQVRERGGRYDVGIHLGHAEAMKQAVLDHGWVSLLPRYSVLGDLASGRLREVEVRGLHVVEGIGLHRRSTKVFSPLQQTAVDAIRAISR